MRFVKFEENENYLLAQIESEFPVEGSNSILIHYHQFLSDMVDDLYNCNRLMLSRRVHSELVEINPDEFSKLVQKKLQELQNQDFSQPVKVMSGKLKPKSLIKNIEE